MVPASIYTFRVVSKGSKLPFIYVLMAFTLVDGLCNIGFFLVYVNVKEITVDGKLIYVDSHVGFQTVNYIS